MPPPEGIMVWLLTSFPFRATFFRPEYLCWTYLWLSEIHKAYFFLPASELEAPLLTPESPGPEVPCAIQNYTHCNTHTHTTHCSSWISDGHRTNQPPLLISNIKSGKPRTVWQHHLHYFTHTDIIHFISIPLCIEDHNCTECNIKAIVWNNLYLNCNKSAK